MHKKTMQSLGALSLFASLTLSPPLQASEAGDIARAIEYRQGLMTVLQWNMKSMGAMMKGKVPYDQTAFARHASDLNRAAGLDILAGFPQDSEGEDSDALPDIWLDFEDFQQKHKDMRSAAKALDQAAQGGDKAAVKPAFEKLGKTCKSCHRAYKD